MAYLESNGHVTNDVT